MNKKNENINKIAFLKKFGGILLGAYVLCAILLRIIAGDQLLYENTQGACVMPELTGFTEELVSGVMVEQIFNPQMYSINKVNVMVGAGERANTANLIMELEDINEEALIQKQSIDMSTMDNSGIITMQLEQPYLTKGHIFKLSLYSDDGVEQNTINIAVNNNIINQQPDDKLFVSDSQLTGRLCFSVDGMYYLKSGQYYWQLVVLIGCILVISGLIIYVRLKKGKNTPLYNVVYNVRKYVFLLRQLVARDFKTKYKRSVLGIVWSFLNPMLTMAVQYFVFSKIFKSDIECYSIYLLIGIICFNFFSEACNRALSSILRNASLITKVYVPKYIYPFAEVLSSLVNFAITLVPLILMIIISGIHYHNSMWISFYAIACLFVFALGLGLFLAAFMVYFRDTQFLWGVITMIWMYATPLFYPISVIPDQYIGLIKLNPLYMYITFIRTCIIQGTSPSPKLYLGCFVSAVLAFAFGGVIFRKMQNQFILKI